jgi:hypothetical protein
MKTRQIIYYADPYMILLYCLMSLLFTNAFEIDRKKTF